MNLLPPADQKKVATERFLRFCVVACVGLACVFAVALAFLAPSYLYLILQSRELERGLQIEKESPELRKAESIESAIKDLNNRVGALHGSLALLRDPAKEIDAVLRFQPFGISFHTFFYKANKGESVGTLTVLGYADTREALLKFVDKLEQSGFFGKVYSPISNLLSREKVEFSLVLDIKKNEP
ncbi:MAG: hypothetical protein HZC14_00855 [Candidatus Niyogibacteria bacterium]|nr:hypothetical protein [Candidatus Niyogibacteria bacterium]